MWRCPKAGDVKADETRWENDKFRKKNDPVNRLYGLASWFRFKLHVLNRNPLCQRILPGSRQCTYPATTVHHLISPRQRPDLFLDAKNVVCLCPNCHPGGKEGTPLWQPGKDYVASVIAPPTVA